MGKQKVRTLDGEFIAGMEAGKHPHPENTTKAITAAATMLTESLIRAYWSGYLCQAHLDNPQFFNEWKANENTRRSNH